MAVNVEMLYGDYLQGGRHLGLSNNCSLFTELFKAPTFASQYLVLFCSQPY